MTTHPCHIIWLILKSASLQVSLERGPLAMFLAMDALIVVLFCVEVGVFNRRWVGLRADLVVNDLERLEKEYGVDAINFLR